MAEFSGNNENEPLQVAESVNNKMPPGSRKCCDCKQIGKFVVLSMFWFGASFANFILPTVIVPSQIHSIVGPEEETSTVGIVMSLQGLGVLIMSPLIGWLSDRLQQRIPFLVWGGIAYAILQILLGFAAPTLSPYYNMTLLENNSNAAEYGVIQPSWGISAYTLILASMGIAAAVVTVAGNGLIVDLIPEAERGAVSAVYSAVQGVGNLAGAFGGVLFSMLGPVGFLSIISVIWTLSVMTTVIAIVCFNFGGPTQDNGDGDDNAEPRQWDQPSRPSLRESQYTVDKKAMDEPGTQVEKVPVAEIAEDENQIPICSRLFVCRFHRLCRPRDEQQEPSSKQCCVVPFLCSYVKPLISSRDFLFVFLARFFFQIGVNSTNAFTEYFVAEEVEIPDDVSVESAVSFCLLAMIALAIAFAMIGGAVSDALGGKRKALVIVASLVMAVENGIIEAFFDRKLWIAISGSALFGVGYGLYLAVDFALVMDVLPRKEDRARDLAVWHQAIMIATSAGPYLTSLVIDFFKNVGCGKDCPIGNLGFIMMWCLAAVYYIIGGLLVLPIKKVK